MMCASSSPTWTIPTVPGPGGTVRMAYVGQNLEMSGYLIGRRMVAEHGLKSGDHCVTPVEFPEDVYAQERYAGVKTGAR